MASANYVQAWGDGLNVAQAGLPATFHINPNGQDMSGITFGVEGIFTLINIAKIMLIIFCTLL